MLRSVRGVGGSCAEHLTVWEIHIVKPEGEKGKAAVGRICRKGI